MPFGRGWFETMDRSDHRQAEILDACLTELISGSASVDDLLRAHSADADWLQPLLVSAQQARQAVELPAMPPEARLVVERRLRAHIRSRVHRAAPRRARRLRPAFVLASLALVVALLGSASGIAYAAEASLPGDGLYVVKTALEQARLALSQTPEGEAALLAAITEKRLQEAEQLSARGRHRDLPAALQGYGRAVDRLLALADQLPAQDGSASLQAIERELARQAQVLSRLQAKAPPAAQAGLMRALQESARNRGAVKKMLEERQPEPGPPPDRGQKVTPASPVTPGKDKEPGKGQGRGRPTEAAPKRP